MTRHQNKVFSEKTFEKLCKKGLTNGERGGILTKPLERGNKIPKEWKAEAKNFRKKFQKPLDKRSEMMYNRKAAVEKNNSARRSLKIEQQVRETRNRALPEGNDV